VKLNPINSEITAPAHLASRIKVLEADLEALPLDANAPDAVTEAHAAFVAAVAWSKTMAGKVDEAEEAAADANKADVAAAVKAGEPGGSGKFPERTHMRKAAGAVEAALLGCEAAEERVGAAHASLIEAVQASFPAWRKQLVQDAAAAHTVAAEAMQQADGALATAHGMYSAVSKLTAGVLSRDPKLAAAARAETRQGLPWYESTHTGPSPLQTVSIPHGKTPVSFPLDAVMGAVAADVAEQGFAQGDWSPPGDPDHDALLNAPLDLSADWVVSGVRRDWGTVCAICRRPNADTVAEPEQGGGLVMVHARCKNRPPDPVELKRQAAREAMSRRGFDAQPGQTQHWQRP